MKKPTGFQIREEERQSWGSITMVWIGAMICVPALMIGGMIGAGLSLGMAALAIFIGYALICVLMSFMGMHACDTGLPTAVMAGGALGEKGAQYIISTILAISHIAYPASAGSQRVMVCREPAFRSSRHSFGIPVPTTNTCPVRPSSSIARAIPGVSSEEEPVKPLISGLVFRYCFATSYAVSAEFSDSSLSSGARVMFG